MTFKTGFLTRDTFHFALIVCVFVFGLSTAFTGQLPPLSRGALFWWPTTYAVIWGVYLAVLFVLILIGRSVLSVRYPIFPSILVGLGVIWTLIAILTCLESRVAVYPDRIDRQVVTLSGLQRDSYRYEDVEEFHVSCKVISMRGNVFSETAYVLNFGDEKRLNLAEARNDGRDGGMWVRAIDNADQILTARGLKRQMAPGLNTSRYRACLEQLAKERTPEEMVVLTRAFTPDPVDKRRRLQSLK